MLEEDKTLSFIHDYRVQEVLWDHDHKDYRNTLKRNVAFDSLGTKHNMNRQLVKNKIKSLRSYFCKEHQKVVKRKRDAGVEENLSSSWFAFKSMLFIVEPKESKESGEIIGDRENTEDPQDNETCQPTLPCEREQELITPLRKNTYIKRTKYDDIKEEAYNLMKKTADELTNKDEFSIFGNFIAAKIRKLNQHNRIIAQHHINNFLFDLEIQEMNTAILPSPLEGNILHPASLLIDTHNDVSSYPVHTAEPSNS